MEPKFRRDSGFLEIADTSSERRMSYFEYF